MATKELQQLIIDLRAIGPYKRLEVLRVRQASKQATPAELAEITDLLALGIRVRQATQKRKART